jgi:hypothetical protein
MSYTVIECAELADNALKTTCLATGKETLTSREYKHAIGKWSFLKGPTRPAQGDVTIDSQNQEEPIQSPRLRQ